VWLRTGPFSVRVQSRIPHVAEGLAQLYGQFEVRIGVATARPGHVLLETTRISSSCESTPTTPSGSRIRSP